MAVENIKVTLLCLIERVWDTVTDLNNYYWKNDLKDI